jgi:hypothetical protein
MSKAQRYDRQNPRFANTDTGVSANHNSTIPSTDHTAEGDHAQADEAITNIPARTDPNLSGTTATEDVYTWLAGRMDGWKENDDYRAFLERSVGPCSRLVPCYEEYDNDYDDNGQIPTAIGEPYGQSGGEFTGTLRSSSAQSYPLSVSPRRV